MDIYFCLSYLSVPHTITLIRNKYAPDFLIITSNKQLYKFFTELYNKDNIKLIPSFSYTISFSKGIVLFPIKLIWIWRMKHKTWNTFKGIENQNVYFFFNASAYSHAWIIYKLSKRNTIFYQEDINLSAYPRNVNLKTWINKQFLNLIYKLQAYPIDLGNGLITYKIKTEYFTKVNAESLKIELNYKEISKWVNNLIDLPRGDILLLTGLMPEWDLTVENYIKWSDILIARLKKCGYTVHFKMHSRQSVKYSLEKSLYEVPKYLPASLLLHYNIYISYMSSALIEAANNDIFTISLINYFPSNNEKRKENFKNTLKKNLDRDKVIYFPSTLNEILNIIDNFNIPKQKYYNQKNNETYSDQYPLCPVCKRRDNTILYTVNSITAPTHFFNGNRDKFLKLKSSIDNIWEKDVCSFHQCNYCDFCFSIPFTAGNREYYSILYDSENNYPIWKWEFNITIQAIRKLVENRKSDKKINILEIGAGNAIFIKRLITDIPGELDITCTEYSESSINSLSALNINCHAGDVRELDDRIYKNWFDIICMFQVLEHLDDLDKLFLHLNNISNDKCNLFIGVPNFAHRSFFDKYGFIEDIPPHHISRWNEKSLRIIGQRFGWELANYQIEPFDFSKFVNKFRNVIFRSHEFSNRINNKLIRKLFNQIDKILSYIRLFFYLPRLKKQITNDLGLTQWAHFRRK